MTAVINIVLPKSLDSLGRVIAVMRRARAVVSQIHVTSEDRVYRVRVELSGDVEWLVARLDRLPEVLRVEYETAPARPAESDA